MAKQSGVNSGLLVAGYNISGDVSALDSMTMSVNLLEDTGLDKSAVERMAGNIDGSFEATSYFNPSAGQAHPILSAISGTDKHAMFLVGTTLGNPAMCMVAKETDYKATRGEDLSLTFKSSFMGSSYALEWGHQLTAGPTASTGAEDLTGFDDGAGAATDFGLQLYVQVAAIAGGNLTVTIEDSDDDASTDPYATVTGAATSAFSAIGAQRVQTSRTENVKEWLRVALTGTYTSATLSVVVVRNTESIVF